MSQAATRFRRRRLWLQLRVWLIAFVAVVVGVLFGLLLIELIVLVGGVAIGLLRWLVLGGTKAF
jgi:hypothetical protein